MGLPSGLPPGRLVTPKLWVSDDQQADVTTMWLELQAGHAESGWWPLLLVPDIDVRDFGPEQDVDVDAERFLSQRWQSPAVAPYTEPDPAGGETTAPVPYASWPGLAPGCLPGQNPDHLAAWYVASTEVRAGAVSDPFAQLDVHPDTRVPNPFVGSSGRAYLGLAESPDSAGTVAAIGWTPSGGYTAVLRSWQERFGVRLCALGTDWLAVTVGWPIPVGEIEHARRVAAEHVAFCPDILDMTDFEDYARGLIAASVWRFWWD